MRRSVRIHSGDRDEPPSSIEMKPLARTNSGRKDRRVGPAPLGPESEGGTGAGVGVQHRPAATAPAYPPVNSTNPPSRADSFQFEQFNLSFRPADRVGASKRTGSTPSTGSVSEDQQPMLHKKKPNRAVVRAKILALMVYHQVARLLADFVTAFTYVFKDLSRKKKNFVIGVFTVLLVVVFVTTMQNAVQVSPLIFLKLSENAASEMDLVMVGSDSYYNSTVVPGGNVPLLGTVDIVQLVNAPEVYKKLDGKDVRSSGSSPRWFLPITVHDRDDMDNSVDSWLLVFDTKREKEIGLGRSWTRRALNENECYITTSIARTLGINADDGTKVVLNLNVTRLTDTAGLAALDTAGIEASIVDSAPTLSVDLPTNINGTAFTGADIDNFLFNTLGLNNPNNVTFSNVTVPSGGTIEIPTADIIRPLVQTILSNLEFRIVVHIVDGVQHPDGKWPDILGNVVAMEMDTFPLSLIGAMRDATLYNPALQDFVLQNGISVANITRELKAFEMEKFGILVATMYEDRFKTYMKDAGTARADIITWTNGIAAAMGVRYPVQYQVPLLIAFTLVSFLRLFLDQIFNAVVVILVILGSILIYSLLLSDVEERNYDYGMLRALGMKKNTVVYIMVIQGLAYGIPGMSIGLFVSWLVSIPVLYGVSTFTKVPPVFVLHPIAVAAGSAVGLLMPMVANILPIRRALRHTLRDSLDLYHQSSNEVKVTMIKLEKMGLSATQIYVSLLLVVAGFTVFYMVPYSFQFEDFALFFTIMNGILLGMLIGLTLVAQIFQPYLEKVLLWLMIWGPERRLAPTVYKNMGSHRSRNKKTALMFTVAVAFIIFAGTTFALQSNGIIKNLRLAFGADIVAQTSDTSAFNSDQEEERNADASVDEFEGLPEEDIRKYFKSEMARSDTKVEDFTFVTPTLTTSKYVRRNRLSSLARTPAVNARFFGVEKNFLNVVYSEFFLVSESEPGIGYDYIGFPPQPDLVKSLYTDPSKSKTGYTVPPVVTTGYIDDMALYAETDVARINSYSTLTDAIVSEAVRNRIAINAQTPIALEVRRRTGIDESDADGTRASRTVYLGNTRGMISKCPGFFFSSRQLLAWNSPVLTTVQTWDDMYIFGRWGTNSTAAPAVLRDKERLFVRLKSGATLEDRERVINGIRAVFDQKSSQVLDTETALASTRLGAQMMQFFFTIVACIAMSLCFFLLLLTVQANMRDNAWEFGVLRALGLSSFMMVRVYVYEGLALIMSSLILGTITGILIAITLTLQFNVFLEFPFEFAFPWEIFIAVVVMAFTFAIVGATIPVLAKAKKPISGILKKLD